MKRTKSGFTLIELLVVIAIIGLLSTLSIIALNSARARARDAKRISDVKQMQIALEMFYNENNAYPVSTAVIPGASISSTGGEPFLRAVPTPPSPYDGSVCNTDIGESGYMKTKYNYIMHSSDGSIPSYSIYFCIGQTVGTGAGSVTGNEVRTMTPAGIF
jgi:prepilin-type N-terminal cleavage/methylation domain-containing protein